MQAATIAVAHDIPPAVILWPLLLAAAVYLLLRSILRTGGRRDVAAAAARHALWVGIIGWMGSSLLPVTNAGILPVPGAANRPIEILPALAWPVFGCLAAHVLGQLSYFGSRSMPAGPRHIRRIREFLPRRLSWTVAVVFLLSAAQIIWTSTLPGFSPLPYESWPDGTGSFVPRGGEGRIPGVQLAAYLGGALLVLVLGTLLVLVLVAHRPPLPGLGTDADGLLRAITTNRFLRTVATVASGLAAIAGNHAARPDPATGPANWLNPAGALNLAVLLLMLLWAPPRLPGRSPARWNGGAGPQPVTRLVVSIGAVMGLAAFAPVPAAIFAPGAVTGSPALFVAASAAAVLAVVALGELLVHRNYGAADQPCHWPRQTVPPAMAGTLVVAAAVLVAVVVVVAWRQVELEVEQTWPVTAWTSAGLVLVSGVPLAFTRRRSSVAATVPGLDAALRAITVHRVIRTLAAFLAAEAGVLLMSAGPKLHRTSPTLDPDRWGNVWEAAPAVGALLAAAAVVVAVIPVAGHTTRARAAAPPVRDPQPVDLGREHPNAL